MNRRRLRCWAGLALAVALLSGCVRVPTSGPVVRVEASRAPVNAGVRVNPHPPAHGASAADVVEGFLMAMAADESGFATARQYLTDEAAQRWNPDEGVKIYASGVSPEERNGRWVLDAGVVGVLAADGTYQQASDQVSHDFGVVRDANGEWRVSQPPAGLLISQSLFPAAFVRVVVYHHAPSASWLVADPRYFPRGPRARELAARAVLAGPPEWLSGAVDPPPPGLSLADISVSETGLVRIGVAAASPPSPEAARRVAAELVWTFRSFAYVSHVSIEDASGRPWSLPRVAPGPLAIDAFAAASPSDAQLSRQLFVVNRGHLARAVDVGGSVQMVAVAPAASHVTAADVRGDGSQAAVVENGTTIRLVGVSEDSSQQELSAGAVGRPDYARQGEVFVPVDGGVRVLTGGSWRPTPVAGLPAGSVTRVRVAPDGVRIAIVVRLPDGRGALGIARVERSSGGVTLSGWREVVVQARDDRPAPVLDVGWDTDSSLMVVADLGGNAVVVQTGQEGGVATNLGPASTEGLSEISVAPGVAPVVLRDSGEVLRYSSNLRWLPYMTGVTGVIYPD